MKNAGEHLPVLLSEVINYLAIKKNGIYVDATFGRGGHSQEILKHLGPEGRLLAIDKDKEAVEVGKTKLGKDKRFSIKQGSFSMLQTYVLDAGFTQKVDGVLLDLGVSSPQLDDPTRGFSFLQEGPLDMRMDQSQKKNAKDWINSATEREIAYVLQNFGEERFSRRIAKAILREREQQAITSTLQLAKIVAKANPKWELHKHPATRTFQAIRIFINNELEELQSCLQQALDVLAIHGRLLVISFHSLEDRIVKKFIQQQERGGNFPAHLPLTQAQVASRMRRLAWGVRATQEEVAKNSRSRSAVLRVAEKLQ